ncbi:MAG: 2-oxoglutarate and iron-dependent oxygenase domain-containing protein [Caulobacteraceae bacterium]
MSLPVIDISALFGGDRAAQAAVAAAIASACEDDGFFYVVGHGVAPGVLRRLEAEARAFFDLPTAEKQTVAMERGGAAWRGWFPLGGELTSGRPDNKEGLYLGEELGADDPRVAAGWPLHGANLWPAAAPGLRPAAEAFFDAATLAAAALMQGISLALGLDTQYFARHYLQKPTRLFRIFNYPPTPPEAWGVAEHTDYGLLTLLAQDDAGGLEVRARTGWRSAPPIPGALVCNIGDMLERLTGGRFVSTPHRVVNRGDRPRLSFPFFYDPDFTAEMTPVPGARPARTADQRWDGADVHAVSGTYGDYLLAKVGRVFPGLRAEVLPG